MMKSSIVTLFLVASFALPFGVTAQTYSDDSDETSPFPNASLSPGDVVQITVWRRPELSGEYYVTNEGAIAHPFYQDVRIGGLSPQAAAQRIKTFLEGFENSPQVWVDPLYRVSVGGEVRQPRLYTLRPEYTISEAIDMAGGPTQNARLDGVRLYRNGTEQRLDLRGVDASASMIRVQSGDRIVVERNASVFRDVVRPTITILGSIASIAHIWIRIRR